MLRGLSFLLATFFFAVNVSAVDYPAPDEYVTDVSGLLGVGVEEQLEANLTAYEAETGTEIAVVIIPLIPGDMSANEYATNLGNSWGVGKSAVDNGAVFLIETDDIPGERDVYIATGSQLEGGLTDIEAAAIVREVVIPHFQAGQMDAGIAAGVEGIQLALAGEEFTQLRMADGISNGDIEAWIQVVMFAIFFVIPWLGAVLGRSKEIWPGGAIGGVSGLVLGGFLGWALLGVVLTGAGLAGLGLLFDWLVSREYQTAKKAGRSVHWWAGGGSRGGGGGSSFGGFGGGGFSGGGGGGRW